MIVDRLVPVSRAASVKPEREPDRFMVRGRLHAVRGRELVR